MVEIPKIQNRSSGSFESAAWGFIFNEFFKKKKKKKIYFCVTSLVNAVITGGFIHKTDARLLRAEQELLGFLHLQSHCGGIKQPVQSTPSQPAS